MARKALSAGFTGDIADPTGASARTKAIVDRARDEAGLVAAHATDHPAVTGSALAVVALVAFATGYMLGTSSAPQRHRWR